MTIHKNQLIRAVPMTRLRLRLPYYAASVSAGFPSPADDYIEARLSLDELVIRNPSSTFFVKVEGDSMIGAGIYDGDILVVDRSLEARPKNVIVAIIDGEFTVKRFVRQGDQYFLKAENARYPLIPIGASTDFQVWGVVIRVVHDPYQL